MPTFYLTADAVPFESEEALLAYVAEKRVDPAKFFVIKGSARLRLNPQIALLPYGGDTPAAKRAPVDTAARDAIDEKVRAFLVERAPAPHTSLEQVATCNGITKPEATAVLHRLKKAGKVASPGRNQWAAAKPAPVNGAA